MARPESQVTGRPLDLQWGPNWEDDLAGAPELARLDPNLKDGVEEHVRLEYEKAFMFYLPRICEHCLNPSCVASCPSGAMYKREEDGIVLVDQEQCRSWRMCVSGCPYKKVYFNWSTGKAEKCTLCYPRIEAGQPTICSETCVGKIRYLGVVLYDADRVQEAASVPDEKAAAGAALAVPRPDDPEVREQGRRDGIAEDWLDAARRSPVYALAVEHRVALPLHPEYRTLPMVWYVPPLSPVMSLVEGPGPRRTRTTSSPRSTSSGPDQYLRHVMKLTAGDPEPVVRPPAARRDAAGPASGTSASARRRARRVLGMEPAAIDAMFRLLAIAKYDERYVIPQTHGEIGINPHSRQGVRNSDFRGRPRELRCDRADQHDPFGVGAARGAGFHVPRRVERRVPRLPEEQNAKLLVVLLVYPDEALPESLPELRGAAAELPRAERRASSRCWTGSPPPAGRASSLVRQDLRLRPALRAPPHYHPTATGGSAGSSS